MKPAPLELERAPRPEDGAIPILSRNPGRLSLIQAAGYRWRTPLSIIITVAFGVIAAMIILWRVKVQLIRGPGWDTYAFLGNAMEFAGQSIGYSELHRPPFLSFLVSLVFRLGFVSQDVILAVDGVIFLLGVYGLYLLLRLRFGAIESAVGSLLFLCFPVVMQWAAMGYSDLASISFSIWAIYVAALAAQGNPRLWAIAVPLTVVALLTRYTAILMLFPLFVVIVLREKVFRRAGPLALGLLLSIGIYLPFAGVYLRQFGEILFPFTLALSVVEDTGAAQEIGEYEPSLTWYLANLPSFILPPDYQGLAIPLLALTATGVAVFLWSVFQGLPLRERLVLAGSFLLFGLIFMKGGLIIRQASIIALTITAFFCLPQERRERHWLDLVMIAWFLVYFDVHSHQAVKDSRYFLVMAPPLVYLTLAGLNGLRTSSRWATARLSLWSAALLLMVAASTVSFLTSYREIKPEYPSLTRDVVSAAAWLKSNDPEIEIRTIYSDTWVDLSWYLGQNVQPMPTFKDKRAMNNELVKYRADYYVSLGSAPIPSYDVAKKVGEVLIYRRNRQRAAGALKPQMLYLGKNWEHYLEDALSFRYQLIYRGGKYGRDEGVYLDGVPPSELNQYQILLAYNFRWRNRQAAEERLRKYVEGGGRLVIDASGTWNMGDIAYYLDKQSLLNTVIQQRSARTKPEIRLSPLLEEPAPAFSPFISDGRPWYGMTYRFPEPEGVTILAELDGNALLALQKLGKGKVLWVGYNFVFHAFDSENRQERRVLRKAFELLGD